MDATLAVLALHAWQQALQPHGLRLNATKTDAWSPAGRAVLTAELQAC